VVSRVLIRLASLSVVSLGVAFFKLDETYHPYLDVSNSSQIDRHVPSKEPLQNFVSNNHQPLKNEELNDNLTSKSQEITGKMEISSGKLMSNTVFLAVCGMYGLTSFVYIAVQTV
jgi:hypothetical protein